MIKHCLHRGYTINAVCREQSVPKLDQFKDQITIFPGPTNDRDVIKRAVEDCDGVLVVLAPWGFINYSSGTAQAVLDFAKPGARLIFSCGWHISRDGLDKYTWQFRLMVKTFGFIGWATRLADLNDQVVACRKIFESDTKWTVVRGSDLEEGESEGLPVWSRHIGDPVLASNLTRRIDFALFMVAALDDGSLVKEAPAIVGCKTASALKFGGGTNKI
jgi:NAD(P)H-binding